MRYALDGHRFPSGAGADCKIQYIFKEDRLSFLQSGESWNAS
jgi:hypothetical protein